LSSNVKTADGDTNTGLGDDPKHVDEHFDPLPGAEDSPAGVAMEYLVSVEFLMATDLRVLRS